MKDKVFEFINKYKIFIILFGISFIIRFIFIFKDLPFITHPDEPTVVNSTLNLRYDLNPKHFDWPTFYYYINYIFFSIIFFIERVMNRIGYPIPDVVAVENFYLLSRVITAVFGSLSVVFIYLFVKNLTKNSDVSLLSAVFLSILPFHITRSAQSLTDVPMLFFVICSLYFLSKNLDQFQWKNIYLSSLFVGFAVSTKYNGYMLALSVLLFLIMIKGFSLKEFKNYLLSGFSALGGFLIGTPYALLDYTTFLRDDGPKGALWQFKNVGSLDFFEQLSAFASNLIFTILPDLAFIPWILSLVFIFFFIFKGDYKKKDAYSKFIMIMIIQFIFILWSVSGVKIQRSHYFIALYAFVPVFSSLLIVKNTKLTMGALIITAVLSLHLLASNMLTNSRVEFYDRVVFTNDKGNYHILYNDSGLKEVLKKLNVDSDEFNPDSSDLNFKNYSHIITSRDMCSNSKVCELNLIEKITNKEKGNDILIYEVK